MAGLGRMGVVHALHILELSRETDSCVFSALVDPNVERAKEYAQAHGLDAPVFATLGEMAAANVADATVLATPTHLHNRNALELAAAGHRMLLEKPLTGTLAGDIELAGELDRRYPNAVMLAFQRRFDAPLAYARDLVREGVIGRPFKIYSALEDSGPAPNGYSSPGILADMSVHNVDEVIWVTGANARSALAIGSRLHNHAHTTAVEDFDDAALYVWFDNGSLAQIQVSRNHVSGYRVESIIFGEEGQIQIGHFDQRPKQVVVETFGRRDRLEPLARRAFDMRQYGGNLPEFIDRFGAAYKAEVAAFIECCRSGEPFSVTHRDGVRAQQVIEAAMKSVLTESQACPVK